MGEFRVYDKKREGGERNNTPLNDYWNYCLKAGKQKRKN
jgi:hypothetical protein